MKKRLNEIAYTMLGALIFLIIMSLVVNLVIHDIQLSAFVVLGIMIALIYFNYKWDKTQQAEFNQLCEVTYGAVLGYVVACMQTSSWAPNITAPSGIESISSPYYAIFQSRSFKTTLRMRAVNRSALTSENLTQLQQILDTDLREALQKGIIQFRNVKVGFPINNNNEIHVPIEVFL